MKQQKKGTRWLPSWRWGPSSAENWSFYMQSKLAWQHNYILCEPPARLHIEYQSLHIGRTRPGKPNTQRQPAQPMMKQHSHIVKWLRSILPWLLRRPVVEVPLVLPVRALDRALDQLGSATACTTPGQECKQCSTRAQLQPKGLVASICLFEANSSLEPAKYSWSDREWDIASK